MIAGLRRRIGQLEQRIGGESITVHLPDGSVRPVMPQLLAAASIVGLVSKAEIACVCSLVFPVFFIRLHRVSVLRQISS